MFQAFVIVLREGFEAFLIVSVIISYLSRTNQAWLLPAAYRGIVVSIFASVGLGYFLYQGANTPLWEGIFGVIAAVMVTTLVVQMWRQGRFLKQKIEKKLEDTIFKGSKTAAYWGVFVFTLLMISREGMETALMLMQVPQGQVIAGASLGIAATAAFAWFWSRVSHLINLKIFFQVTGVFLLLFVVQILIYSAHEFSETGLFPNSDAFHAASEPYGPDGLYGQWYPVVMIGICTAWMFVAWVLNLKKPGNPVSPVIPSQKENTTN